MEKLTNVQIREGDLLRLLASSSQNSWPFLDRGSSLSAKLHGEWEGTPAGDGEHFPYKLGLDGILLKHHPPLSSSVDPPTNPPFHGGPCPHPHPHPHPHPPFSDYGNGNLPVSFVS